MTRPDSTARGYDHKWSRTRGRYLKHHPRCQHPGCDQPATQVHHLDGQGPKGPRGHKWDNLQGLCATCHSRTTVAEQPGAIVRHSLKRRPRQQHPGLIG